MTVKVLNQQSVQDIALIYLGDAAAAPLVMYANLSKFNLGLDTVLLPGTELTIPAGVVGETPTTAIVNGQVVSALQSKTYQPATEVEVLDTLPEVSLDGIGYMIIEGGPPTFRVFPEPD
jgi:hypothetical protein